jgi:hypothetical protein
MAATSALGHKRTNHREPKSTFVRFGPKADKTCGAANVRYVPIADISQVIFECKKKDRLAAVFPKSDQVF